MISLIVDGKEVQVERGTTILDAAKEVRPGRCGYGMFGFLALAGPFYSMLYTYVGIHPDSFLAHVTQPDPSIPRGVAGAAWCQVPEIWWLVVEKLSWSALARPGPGCAPTAEKPSREALRVPRR